MHLKSFFADTSECFWNLHRHIQPGIPLLSLPSLEGREWALPKSWSLPLSLCVHLLLLLFPQKDVLVVWGSGCQGQWAAPAASAAALIPCFHPSSLARRSSCPFPSNLENREIFLGNFSCPLPPCPRLDLVLPVEGIGINAVIMCFLYRKLLSFECLVSSNHIFISM